MTETPGPFGQPPEPPQPLPRGVAQILQLIGGAIVPVALLFGTAMILAAFRGTGDGVLVVMMLAEIVLGLACLWLLARRRAAWFAVPCVLVSAMIVFVVNSCRHMHW